MISTWHIVFLNKKMAVWEEHQEDWLNDSLGPRIENRWTSPCVPSCAAAAARRRWHRRAIANEWCSSMAWKPWLSAGDFSASKRLGWKVWEGRAYYWFLLWGSNCPIIDIIIWYIPLVCVFKCEKWVGPNYPNLKTSIFWLENPRTWHVRFNSLISLNL